MAYLTVADMRTATLASFASGIALDSTEAPDAAVTAVIAAKSQRFDAMTSDHFEPDIASLAITAASTTGTVATFTVANTYAIGDYVTVAGVTPAGYNGTWVVLTASSTQFTADIGSTPAAGSIFGTATKAGLILIDSANGTRLLPMPKRVRAVYKVETRGLTGAYYSQLSTNYTYTPFVADNWLYLKTPDVLEIVPGRWLALTGAPAMGGSWPMGDRWPIGVGSVRVTGDFGWPAVPWQAQRAVALTVWDHFKQYNPDERRAIRSTTNDQVLDLAPLDPDHPTGIVEADELIRLLRRDWVPLMA